MRFFIFLLSFCVLEASAIEVSTSRNTNIQSENVATIQIQKLGIRLDKLNQEVNARDVCSAEYKFYTPEAPTADANGCTEKPLDGTVLFGGGYALHSGIRCHNHNVVTGECTCPDGFTEQTLAQRVSGAEQYIYVCLKGDNLVPNNYPIPAQRPRRY